MMSSFLPILAAWTLGKEVPLGKMTIQEGVAVRSVSSVASNGRDFLVLWSDSRNYLDPDVPRPFPALYASRVDASGRPLNPIGTKLFDSASGRMTWTGNSYLLVYMLPTGQSFAQELDDDGNRVGDPKEIAFPGETAAMASNGETALLIQGYSPQGSTISILNRDGTTRAVKQVPSTERVRQPFVLPGGDYAFILTRTVCQGFSCSLGVWLNTIGGDGVGTEIYLFDVSELTQVSAAASDDGRIIVAVQQDQSPGARTAAYEVIRLDGRVVAPMTTVESRLVRYLDGSAIPSAGWDGREFLVIVQWPLDDGNRSVALHGFRIAPDGTLLDASPRDFGSMLNHYPERALFASSVSGQLMAWTDFQADGNGLLVRAANTFEQIVSAPSHNIAFSPPSQLYPRIAPGSQPLSVWIEGNRNAVVKASVVGGTESTVSHGTVPFGSVPAVARGNSTSLVVWLQSGPQIVGRRVSSSGDPIGDPFVIATEEAGLPNYYRLDEDLSVAFDGTRFLVAWLAGLGDVHVARVSEQGQVLDALPLVLSKAQPTSIEYGSRPRVLGTSGGFVVAWIQQRYCNCGISPEPPPVSTLNTARVTDDGAVVRLNSIWSRTGADQLVFAPVGTGILAAIWREATIASAAPCLYRTVLRDDGTAASGVAPLRCETWSAGGGAAISNVDAAWNGNELVLVWRDAQASILVQRFDPIGALAIDDPQQVNPSGTLATLPSITSAGNRVTIAYQRLAEVSRVFARTLDRVEQPPRRRAMQ